NSDASGDFTRRACRRITAGDGHAIIGRAPFRVLPGDDEFAALTAHRRIRTRWLTIPHRTAHVIEAGGNRDLSRRTYGRVGAKHGLASIGRTASCIDACYYELRVGSAIGRIATRLTIIRGAIPDRAAEVVEPADS